MREMPSVYEGFGEGVKSGLEDCKSAELIRAERGQSLSRQTDLRCNCSRHRSNVK